MSNFNEWYEKNGELYREPTSDERYLFEAGAASRQAEIDALKEEVNEAIDTILKMQEKECLLQKRIDEALRKIESFNAFIDVHSVYEILKGESK